METILSMTLAGSLAILGVLPGRWFLRKAPKIYSYALWLVVLFRLLSPVGIPVSLPQAVPALTGDIPFTTVRQEAPIRIETPQARTITTALVPEPDPLSVEDILTGLWLTGVAAMLLYSLISSLRFQSRLKTAVPVRGCIYQADHIGSAFVVGFLFPKIYLPSELPISKMDYIIAHEQTHIRRLDPITRHLAYLALSLHWFNPLVWLAFVLSGRDMEMSCDESVIRKLGPQILAPYSESLLSLAAGRPVIPGSPLAFGEGDTRSRIMNLVNFKPITRRSAVLCTGLCLIITTLCACQPAPEKPAVVSKNEGIFEERMTVPAAQSQAVQTVSKHETFTSTDGSVEFTWNIDMDLPQTPMPVVEVMPHILTGEEARSIFESVVGKEPFYELEDEGERVFSKEEIQYMLGYLAPCATKEGYELVTGIAPDETYLEEALKPTLESLNRALETAPEGNPHTLTDWKFKTASDYYFVDDDATKALLLRTKYDGFFYTASATVRDRKDQKLNHLGLNLGMGMEKQILLTQKERRFKPGQEDINAIYGKAMEILGKLPGGPWVMLDPVVRETSSDQTGSLYTVDLRAVPSFGGVPALNCQSPLAFNGSDTVEATYQPAQVFFTYLPDGLLLDFTYDSPVDVKETVNPAVQTMTTEDLMAQVQSNMSLMDVQGADYGDALVWSVIEYQAEEPIIGKVEITNLEYGLARTSVKDSTFRYYYTPALVVRGHADYYGQNSGTRYTGTGDHGGTRDTVLTILNAVDGTILE